MFVKPRLYGMRCWMGSCPPSNPRRTPGPLRDFWPLVPRPAVLPLPLPWPRPTRLRSRCAPSPPCKSSSVRGIVVFPIGGSALCVGPRFLFSLQCLAVASWLTHPRQLFYLDEMTNLGHHATDRSIVRPLDCGIQLAQSQRCD